LPGRGGSFTKDIAGKGGSFTTPAYLHLRHNSIFRLHHIGTVVNLISQIKKQQPQKNV